MCGYFGSALDGVFALGEVDAKGLFTGDGVKAWVGFHSLVGGKVPIFGYINLQQLIPQDSILMINMFLCFSPFTFLINQLIINPQ